MIQLNGNSLSLEQFDAISNRGEKVSLSPAAKAQMLKSRAAVDKAVASGERFYSINTGFGILSKVKIDPSQLETLQENFIRSHCAAVGEPHNEAETRAILLLRANVLAKGLSGVRPDLAELLCEMLNRGVHPVIPSQGSVGCSGDLAPLAHLASVLIGEGEAFVGGKRMPGADALKQAGLKPVKLAPKEGLSLTNGTQQMTGLGGLVLVEAERLADIADLVCSVTLEGTLGSPRAYADWVHEARPFEGQMTSAAKLRSFMEDSEIYKSHLKCDRVQDPYSIRCAPQVHGACRDLFKFVRSTLSIELNAATDNPLVNPDTGEICSNGNFHGQPIAFALDIMGMGISELSSISERRIAKLINPVFSELPTFLVKEEGLNSGFMIPQYTAAHLVVENRMLTHPASTDSIPTNNDKEDHNSMGPVSARKARTILKNTQYVLAIEMLAACQALEFRKPLKPGRGPRFVYDFVRKEIPALEKDRYMSPDIERAMDWIRSGRFYRAAEEAGIL